jgi:dynein light intermediate chain 1, cytosolic
MDLLEREMGYKEELFDFIQQFLRTILLKRIPPRSIYTNLDGASLHYLSPGHHQSHLSLLSLLSPSNALQSLIPPAQYSELLKPNVVDRDHVFVPSGWDSWGKIRVLRDGFDVEGVCEGWSVDIASVLADKHPKQDEEQEIKQSGGGSLEVYEDTITDPKRVLPS